MPKVPLSYARDMAPCSLSITDPNQTSIMNTKTIVAALLGIALFTTACNAEGAEVSGADGCSSCETYLSDPTSNAMCTDQVDAYNDVIECVCNGPCASSCGQSGDFCDGADMGDACTTCLLLPDILGGCNTTIYVCQSL